MDHRKETTWGSLGRGNRRGLRRRFTHVGQEEIPPAPPPIPSLDEGDAIEDVVDYNSNQIIRMKRMQGINTVLLILVLFLCSALLVAFGGWNIHQEVALYGYGRNDHKIDNIEDTLDNRTDQIIVLQGNVSDLNETLNSITITDNGTTLVNLIDCVDPICDDPSSFYGGINDTRDDVDTLQNCTDPICSDPDAFYGNIETIETNITVLQGDVDDLQNCTSDFCAAPDALNNNINSLNSTIQLLVECTNDLCMDNVSGFFNRIDFLNNSIIELTETTEGFNDSINDLETCTEPICNNATAFFNGIDTLESKVDDLENCTSTFCEDPDALAGDIANLTSQLDTLETAVAVLENCTETLCANPELLFGASSGVGPNFIHYSSPANTTFVVPTNVSRIYIAIIGGGGGGGAGGNSADAPNATNPMTTNGPGGGGGGGGCAYPVEQFLQVTEGESLTIIIGAGGAGAATTATLKGDDGENSQIYQSAALVLDSKGGLGGYSGFEGDGSNLADDFIGNGGDGFFGGGAGSPSVPGASTSDGGSGVWVDGENSNNDPGLSAGNGAPPQFGSTGGGLGGFNNITNNTLEGYFSGSGGGGASPQPFLHYSFDANGFGGNGATGVGYQVSDPLDGEDSGVPGGGGGGGAGGFGSIGMTGNLGSAGGGGGDGYVTLIY